MMYVYLEKTGIVYGQICVSRKLNFKKYGTSIKSAFYNSKYIGVILDADDGNKNELEVFELSGKRKLKIELSEQYKQVQLNDNNEIMLNSDSKCVIYKMNGIKKFSSNIKGKV